jgi:hypothetical protein
MSMGYQGWSNHDTWAFRLHIDSNEGDYLYWQEEAGRIACKSVHPDVELADALKEWFEEVFQMVLDGTATEEAKLLIQDCGNGSYIDWFEVAESLLEEYEGDEPEKTSIVSKQGE